MQGNEAPEGGQVPVTRHEGDLESGGYGSECSTATTTSLASYHRNDTMAVAVGPTEV